MFFCRISFVLALVVLSGCHWRQARPLFQSDVSTDAKPWTHLNFKNDPESFQFAVVTDRTGGHRPGIFPKAVNRLNLLQPEFVVSVGDLIEGYTTDINRLQAEWKEFEEFANAFEMPFFFVGGNHDLTNDTMYELWHKKFGPTYYHFIYRDVLFLCLDSQDGDAKPNVKRYQTGMSDKQVDYALRVLEENPQVRWTIVLLHQPIWDYAEDRGRPQFERIEKLLKNRPHTVYAGHRHHYAKYDGARDHYYQLATTGGGSRLRGPNFGELDHVMWVTMTPEGPVMANLTLDGILPHDFAGLGMRENLSALVNPVSGLKFKLGADDSEEFKLKIENKFAEGIRYRLDWFNDVNSPWRVEPAQSDLTIDAGENATIRLKVRLLERTNDVTRLFNLPLAKVNAQLGVEELLKDFEIRSFFGAENYLVNPGKIVKAAKLKSAPLLDGKSDDWSSHTLITDFSPQEMVGSASVETQAWVAHDDAALYVFMKCLDDDIENLKASVEQRDGPIWDDDSIEIYVDENSDSKDYFHWVMNSSKAIYDAKNGKNKWNGNVEIGSSVQDGYWTLEVAIPWKTLNLKSAPEPGSSMGFNLQRLVPGDSGLEILQWSPTYNNALRARMLGRVEF